MSFSSQPFFLRILSSTRQCSSGYFHSPDHGAILQAPKTPLHPHSPRILQIPHAAFDGQGMLPMKRFLIVFLDEVPCLLSCICHRLCSFLEVWLPHNSTYQYSTERPFYSQKCHTGLLFPLSYVHHFAFNQNPILQLLNRSIPRSLTFHSQH